MKTKDVKKAVVLAAGFGTRLKPLTDVLPKPLLPVWGEPMIERICTMLEDWGVEEIYVNAHHLAEKVVAWADARNVRQAKGGAEAPRAQIIVSREKEILGTGGVLLPLKKKLAGAPFWLVNGDVVIEELSPEPIVAAFEASGGFAGCWMAETGPRTIEADPEGRICNWHSDASGQDGTFTYCGVALLSDAIFKYLPTKGFATIVEAYEKAMMTDERFVRGAEDREAFWWDAGTHERYRAVNDGPQPVHAFGDARLDALTAKLGWTTKRAGAEFLCARGSDRVFWRLDEEGGERVIAVEYDDAARPENARYGKLATFLAKCDVPVPEVAADLPEHHILALEEIDGDSLETKANVKGADMKALYRPVIRALRHFHEAGTAAVLAEGMPLEPAFDEKLYVWEQDLFLKHCLDARYGMTSLPADVAEDLKAVRAALRGARPIVVHRDFQSSNVLYRKDGSFAFIDFQGMRFGAAAYDLASVLYDPYVPLGEKERAFLAKEYAQAEKGAEDATKLLSFAAVERLVQALGAFGRLASVGKPEFGKYIPRALGNLLAAADEANLDGIGALAEDLIAKEEFRLNGFVHHHHHDDDHDEDEPCV